MVWRWDTILLYSINHGKSISRIGYYKLDLNLSSGNWCPFCFVSRHNVSPAMDNGDMFLIDEINQGIVTNTLLYIRHRLWWDQNFVSNYTWLKLLVSEVFCLVLKSAGPPCMLCPRWKLGRTLGGSPKRNWEDKGWLKLLLCLVLPDVELDMTKFVALKVEITSVPFGTFSEYQEDPLAHSVANTTEIAETNTSIFER